MKKKQLGHSTSFFKSVLKSLGPGVISGTSDNDPSSIATYSQSGARFTFLWLALFQYPLMAVIQEMSVRIGLITGKSMGEVLKEKYSKNIAIIVYPIASLLLIANTINIGADIGAIAASVKLIFLQTPTIAATLSFTAFILASEILLPYEKYVKILKYLILFLFVYIFTAIIVGGNITQVLFASIIPHIEFTKEYAMMFVAVFGTSISPYVFFWQASEEAEEDLAKNKIKGIGKDKPTITKKEIKLMRIDVAFCMAFSKLIMWTIIITTAGSLHTHGLTDIQTSEQAAKALEPLVRTFLHSCEISKQFLLWA